MGITATLKRMSVGSSETFNLSDYTTLTTTMTRLKVKGIGVYTLERTKDCIHVTRLTAPEQTPLTSEEVSAGRRIRRLKDAIDELDWQAMQADPANETYELGLSILPKDGRAQNIRIPVTAGITELCTLLSAFAKTNLLKSH